MDIVHHASFEEIFEELIIRYTPARFDLQNETARSIVRVGIKRLLWHAVAAEEDGDTDLLVSLFAGFNLETDLYQVLTNRIEHLLLLWSKEDEAISFASFSNAATTASAKGGAFFDRGKYCQSIVCADLEVEFEFMIAAILSLTAASRFQVTRRSGARRAPGRVGNPPYKYFLYQAR